MSELLWEADLQSIVTGLMPGVNELSVPLWKDGRNVEFDAYGVHRGKGFDQVSFASQLFDSAAGFFDSAAGNFDDGVGTVVPLSTGLSVPITGIGAHQLASGAKYLWYGTKTNLYLYDGATAASKGSGYTGYDDEAGNNVATRWNMFPWGDWWLANNGVGTPQLSKSGGNFAALTLGGIFSTAKFMWKYGPHALAVGTNNSPFDLHWSAEDDIEQWDYAVNRTAGVLRLRDFKNPPIMAVPLGDVWAIYSAGEMKVVRYATSQFTRFGVLPGLEGIGAVSIRSIVPVGSLNYGIMKNGIFRTDGTQFNFVSYPRFGEWLESNVNWGQKSKIWGWHNKNMSSIHWTVPLAGSTYPNLTIVYNYLVNSFSFHDRQVNVAAEQDTLEYPVVGTHGGSVLFAEKTYANVGQPMLAYAQTKVLDLGKRTNWKYIDHVLLEFQRLEGTGSLSVYVAWLETPDGTLTFEGPYDIDETMAELHLNRSSRFVVLKFVSNDADLDWNLSGIKVFGQIEGNVI